MNARNEATERQVQAARPDASTWLVANAGSGKTRVLTDRVARLLLDGVQPQNILCLTYTKAAASEMQNRLFARLGEWAMLADSKLAQALVDLGAGGDITPERMRQARTLFARAIEAPGGLKIQTIHSFCASLLRRFPLEAGVSPQFSEMEDRAARLLQAEIVQDFAQGPQAALVDGLAQYISEFSFDELMPAILQHRSAFDQPLSLDGFLEILDLPAGYDEAALERRIFIGGEQDLLDRLIGALKTGTPTDNKAAETLSKINGLGLSCLPVLENLFLFGERTAAPFSAKTGSVSRPFGTKTVRSNHPDLMDEVDKLMLRVEAGRSQRLALETARKTLALHAFARAFLPEYDRRKQLRGWLDFDDQILKARQLLNDPAVAQWVLFRLDGGIDHILVDEAQDTSPEQWDVIEKLAQEFTSGQGARTDVERTIFVVGDKKQSIYSFQGANPDAFDRMQAEFAHRLEDSGSQLQDLSLEFSFRSAETILRLVDLVFENRVEAGFPATSKHRAFKSDLPGRVDLWPVVEKVEEKEDRHWTDPVDRPSPRNHNIVLAERIANRIKTMIEDGETIPDEQDGVMYRRPVQPGDFLILVQRRSILFGEIIRACKAAGLPIAGADRLKVGAELAVKDLGALLSFLSTPEDSLALATALKSPLFGWSEQALFDLAHRRTEDYLWQALRKRGDEFPETLDILNDLRGQIDFLRPYDLIERILTRHNARKRLLARLGEEAEDGINALLSQALAYERSEIPSLTGFLIWMETDDLTIKRQMGSAGNMLRVMTVHGAKGLESPIVILPDTAKRNAPKMPKILPKEDTPIWTSGKVDMPEAMSDVIEATRAKEENERLRLLYVALTRAEKWLIVAAAGDLDKDGNTWYQLIQSGMERAGAVARIFDGGKGLCLVDDSWSALDLRSPETTHADLPDLPSVFLRPAALPVADLPTLSPSDLGGAKAMPGAAGEEEEVAKLRGTRIHLLLEHLPGVPEADWTNAANRILPDAAESDLDDVLGEARKVLSQPDLAHLFGPDILAEVPVTAQIGSRRIHGVIDRLVLSGDTILIVDFKSNATVPPDTAHVPEGILRQMAVYGAALEQIYPGRDIQTAILWTRTASLMHLPHDLVREARGRTPHLDLPAMGF
ncbi:double-strand break repair helicase AddA [Arenibacterium sp. CAU 1754]